MIIIDIINSLIDTGGIIIWPLGILSVVIWLLLMMRINQLAQHKFCQVSEIKNIGQSLISEKDVNADSLFATLTGIELVFFRYIATHDTKKLRASIHSAANDVIEWFKYDHHLIRCLINSAPLLGLLGTVWGMIETFNVITVAGTSEPGLIARGISRAMITTQVGLLIAVPAIFVERKISRWEEWIVFKLEETSMVLIQSIDEMDNVVEPGS